MYSTQQTAASSRCDAAALFPASSEMGRLCPATDWSATPLGGVDDWPSSLRTMAASILDFAYPSMLLWGPDLIQIYNDRYILFLGGSHPGALGISSRACRSEAVQVTEPIYERVRRGGTVMESVPDGGSTFTLRMPGIDV